MRLNKIKLAGFKSFVDPTAVNFPSNLIGVVGPNGCGKSNIIDAVRWVMGEISAKHLRGDFNYAWQTAEIAVMGAKGAVEILYRAELGNPDKIAARTRDYETRFANPFVAAERGFIDEVIMPHSTRRRVARAFASLRTKRLSNPWKKHDNIPL